MAELKSITLDNITLKNENKAILTVDHGNDSATVSQGGSSFGLERVSGGVEFDISGSVVTTLQDKLVNGVNIKTINGENVLGSGNIFIGDELRNGAVEFDGTITEGYAGKLTVEPSTNGYSFKEYNTYSTGETIKELVDKDYVDSKNNYVAQGDWLYKINPDNTFEAYYSKSGVEIEINQGSGAFYRSANMTLTLPTGITNNYNVTIKHADVQTFHNNYPVIGTVSNIATTPNTITYYALSGNTRNKNPHHTVTAHIFGILVAK